ncbi:inositol monophosphatase family protein [Entomobacter blattae]|uniref:Inositol-1-monophosphatase n=1 Tax=Entomobacter blattae TaxID=2762277 RepID=A0A7H1NTC1_9PROT|nr:inositol monophosphatase family protein [Entomobacter blattae]QNT79031.1 Inositol-1-monophosphatase [Entomobacter blattae]
MAVRLSPTMTVMQNTALKAGRRLLRDFNEVELLQVSIKGPGDFVSQADLKAEATIKEELSRVRPGYAFLMEESGKSGAENWDWRWIVDPLDGTSNFLHGVPQWAISIALEKRISSTQTELVSGLVYNPVANEMFWAEKGIGAFLNERRLRVSNRRNMIEALFATGIPFATTPAEYRKPFMDILTTLMPNVAGIRRFGSAALDLAWTAAGRFDGFWEYNLKPWDCAAGILLVREAGGYTTTIAGEDKMSMESALHIVAANPHLHALLLSTIKKSTSSY